MAISTIDNNGVNLGQLGNRNMIINGAMQVAQRGTSVAITGGGYHTIDRWSTIANSSMSYAVTMSQESTDNDTNGFGYSLKLLTTTAQAMTGGQNYSLRYLIEGRDVKHLSYGTSDARVITLSFWVKSNKTGVFSLQVYNGNTGTNYSMLTSYNVNVANTWEYKTIVIPANTGQVMNRTSEIGMMLDFNLASGADDIVSAFSWGLNYNGAARAVTGQVNILDTVNNYFQITGVQLEVGDTATPFEHKNVGQELLACQRYCWRVTKETTFHNVVNMAAYNAVVAYGVLNFPVKMRTSPTFTHSGVGDFLVTGQANDSSCTSLVAFEIATNNLQLGANGSGSLTQGSAYWVRFTSSSPTGSEFFQLDAEL